jgi:hypothetical protein
MTNPNILHFAFCILHSAFCILHFAFLFFSPSFLLAQQTPALLLPPSGTLTNQTNDTLFCIPKQKLEILMEREETSIALFQSLKERNTVTDSLLILKTREAENWYSKLIETEILLEESELLRIQEKQKDRRKTKIWFGVGTVAGLIVAVIL